MKTEISKTVNELKKFKKVSQSSLEIFLRHVIGVKIRKEAIILFGS
jgi:hypothetical protein